MSINISLFDRHKAAAGAFVNVYTGIHVKYLKNEKMREKCIHIKYSISTGYNVSGLPNLCRTYKRLF